MGNRRATDIKNNNKTYLPKALSVKSQAELRLRSDMFREEFEKFNCENFTKEGKQKSNLNET